MTAGNKMKIKIHLNLVDFFLNWKKMKLLINKKWKNMPFQSRSLECVKIPELELSYKTKMIKFKFYGRRKKKVR